MNVGVKTGLFVTAHQHFHRRSDALALSAGPLALRTTPRIRAQNDFLRPASDLDLGFGAGALSLLPVARLYLARPLAVSPAPLETGSFSPRPTAKLTDLRAITRPSKS